MNDELNPDQAAESHGSLRLAVGTVVGLSLCVPILVRGTNLVPDRLEPAVVIAIIAALAGLVFWLRR